MLEPPNCVCTECVSRNVWIVQPRIHKTQTLNKRLTRALTNSTNTHSYANGNRPSVYTKYKRNQAHKRKYARVRTHTHIHTHTVSILNAVTFMSPGSSVLSHSQTKRSVSAGLHSLSHTRTHNQRTKRQSNQTKTQ